MHLNLTYDVVIGPWLKSDFLREDLLLAVYEPFTDDDIAIYLIK